jgi:glycosyltransferase involved in cell wall biosynthesis
MPKEKIIIVSEYFYPNNNSTAYFMTEIAKSISNCNMQIICNQSLKDNIELDFINKDNIIRIKENNYNRNKIITRVIKLIISTYKLSLKTFKIINKEDHIFSVTNPVFLMIILAIFRKFINFKYTLLVYDVFPDNLISSGILKSKKSLIYKLLYKIFNWSYSKVDNLIVIGRDMEKVIKDKIDNKNANIIFIPNWCDCSIIQPMTKEKNQIINKYNLNNKIVFAFTGNFGKVQGIDLLLKASQLVKSKNFILLFIGDGAEKKLINSCIAQNIKNNIIYAGQYPMAQQNMFLNACDIAIISLASNMLGLGVPSKSYFNMAAGKPLFYIGNKQSEIGKVIEENDNGWIVDSDNPQLIANQIDDICSQNNFYYKGKISRNLALTQYNKDTVLRQYKDFING